jgi:hypothetical protein
VALVFERLRTSAPLNASLVAGLCVSSVLATGLVGFVNYVPDDVTSSVWALALPLLFDGFFPVSWLAAWIPNPASGAVLVALLVTLVAWLAARFHRVGATPFLLALVVVLHFGALRVLPLLSGDRTADDHDRGAKGLLESVWLAPRGAQVPFRGL